MGLTIHRDLEQGTDEWLQARAGIVTASVMGQLITPSTLKIAKNETARTLVRTLVAERITGHVDETPETADMRRGNVVEPYARDAYAEQAGVTVEEIGFMVLEQYGAKIGYSPDGLVGDDGLIEIKAPRQKKHLAIMLEDQVPAEYMAQIQTGLLVSGREWLDFISYAGGMPLFVKRVLPDPAWREVIWKAVEHFDEQAHTMRTRYNTVSKGQPVMEHIDLYDDLEMRI